MSGIQGSGYYSNQAPVIGKKQIFYPASAPSPIQNALPNEIRSTRPKWVPTVNIAVEATLKVVTVDKQNLGSCTLISNDLIKMSYHQISGIPIQSIQFKKPGHSNIPPFKVKEIVEFDSLQDYVILSIHKNSNNIYPANPEYIPKISTDRTSQDVLLAHVPNIDLQMSLASIAETPGCSLNLFSPTASMNYSCGGDYYTQNGEIIAMHTASATGRYMGVKDESKSLLIDDIMSVHKESILHDLYKDPSRKFEETPTQRNFISLLPIVETDEFYYTLEGKYDDQLNRLTRQTSSNRSSQLTIYDGKHDGAECQDFPGVTNIFKINHIRPFSIIFKNLEEVTKRESIKKECTTIFNSRNKELSLKQIEEKEAQIKKELMSFKIKNDKNKKNEDLNSGQIFNKIFDKTNLKDKKDKILKLNAILDLIKELKNKETKTLIEMKLSDLEDRCSSKISEERRKPKISQSNKTREIPACSLVDQESLAEFIKKNEFKKYLESIKNHCENKQNNLSITDILIPINADVYTLDQKDNLHVDKSFLCNVRENKNGSLCIHHMECFGTDNLSKFYKHSTSFGIFYTKKIN